MKRKIPKFRNIAEERKFWDTHSITDYLDELKPAYLEFPKPKHILVSIKPRQFTILKEIAFRRGTSYSNLITKWINEGIATHLKA